MTDERERLGRWIRDEARTGDWSALWDAFARTRAVLLERLSAFPDEQATRRPGSGEGEAAWSAAEVARHVLAYTRNVGAIIEATAAGRTESKDPPGTLAARPGSSFAETVGELSRASSGLESLVERLPANPDLLVTVPHAFFGPLNCREWLVFLRFHDSDHLRQIERLHVPPGASG